jgi:glycosidase
MDGVPMLYNGMEVGDTTESGDPALFEKLPVFWQIAKRRPEFPAFYAGLIALRRANPALQQGDTEWVHNADENRVLTFVRRSPGAEFLVAINCSNRPFIGGINASGEYDDVTPVMGNQPPKPVAVPILSLDAWGVRILRRR